MSTLQQKVQFFRAITQQQRVQALRAIMSAIALWLQQKVQFIRAITLQQSSDPQSNHVGHSFMATTVVVHACRTLMLLFYRHIKWLFAYLRGRLRYHYFPPDSWDVLNCMRLFLSPLTQCPQRRQSEGPCWHTPPPGRSSRFLCPTDQQDDMP